MSIAVDIIGADGTGERVTVSLPQDRFEEYLKAIDDETKIVSICTGKSEKWVESLSPDAQDKLMQACEYVCGGGEFEGWLHKLVSKGEIQNKMDELYKQYG